MTKAEIEAAYEVAKQRVTVSCDEAHVHSATAGCLTPKKGANQDAVTVCVLVEHIWRIERAVANLQATVEGKKL